MNPSFIKDLATVGLAIGAPLMLLSGIGVGVTLFSTTPAILVLIFLFAAGLTVVSVLAYLAASAVERN